MMCFVERCRFVVSSSCLLRKFHCLEGFTNSPLVAQNMFKGKSQIESTFILYNMPL